MAVVFAGLTIIQIVSIIGTLAGAGKDVSELADWVEKRKAEGHAQDKPLPPHHDVEAQSLIEQSAGSPEAARAVIAAARDSTAEDFVHNTLGK